jgi:hypothetical protein
LGTHTTFFPYDAGRLANVHCVQRH